MATVQEFKRLELKLANSETEGFEEAYISLQSIYSKIEAALNNDWTCYGDNGNSIDRNSMREAVDVLCALTSDSRFIVED